MRPLRLLPCLLLPLAAPVQATLGTLEDVQACMDANQPEVSLVQEYAMASVDRVGSKRTSQGKSFWKRNADEPGSKALVRVTSPPDVRGTAVLLLHDGERTDIFSYLPEIGRVRRVSERSVSGSFLGTDFSYEDFARIQGAAADASARLLPDDEVEGRPVYVIEGLPAHGDASEYSRLVSFVDQETCVPLRLEGYDRRERLLKVFTLPRERVAQQEGRWFPQHVLVVNEQTGTRTTLDIEDVELDARVPDPYFSQSNFYRRR